MFWDGMTKAMAARLLLAVLSAGGLGWWCWRNCRLSSNGDNPTTAPSNSPQSSRLIAFLSGLSILWTGIWLVLALVRLRYPYELEWCGGSMLDGLTEVLAGRSLYVPPNPGWFGYNYPPVFFYASAVLVRLLGVSGFVAMRLVSVLSTIACLGLMVLWLRHTLSRPEKDGAFARPILLAAPGLLMAAYRMTGAWFDIERIDMLFLALSLGGGLLAVRSSNSGSMKAVVGSGILLALACLTKQQAVLFFIASAVGLAVVGRRQAAIILVTTWGIIMGFTTVYFVTSTGGWYLYYLLEIPRGTGIDPKLGIQFFLRDLPLVAPSLALAWIAWRLRRRLSTGIDLILAGYLLAAILISALSRAHWGGDQNVLIPAFALSFLAATVGLNVIIQSYREAQTPALLLILSQFVVLTYRPDQQLPTPAQLEAGQRMQSLVSTLEREGDVLVLDHGGFTSIPHFHTMALRDVTETNREIPHSVTEAIRSRQYAAIVVDSDSRSALGDLSDSYPEMLRVGIGQTWTLTGYPTPSPARDVWVLRPFKDRAIPRQN